MHSGLLGPAGDYTLNSYRPKPDAPIILDGFGHNESREYNAIATANAPTRTELWGVHPHTVLDCAGESIGLPDDQMGNSEGGHPQLGAGRLINQDFTVVNANGDKDSSLPGEARVPVLSPQVETYNLQPEMSVLLGCAGGEWLITLDHGNVEQRVDPETGMNLARYTTFPVPLVYRARSGRGLADGSNFADVALPCWTS